MNGAPIVGTGKLAAANNLIQRGVTQLGWISVRTDGTNAVTVKVYDGVDATGTLVDEMYVQGSSYWAGRDYFNMFLSQGLFVTISGTNGYIFAGYARA